MTATSPAMDPRALGRLRWRCRRGLLENDLLIERFFARHETALTVDEARGIEALMSLADNDLLDLLLRRKEPEGPMDRPEVRNVLALMRPAGPWQAAPDQPSARPKEIP